jgi:hypothetical protein
MDQLDIGIRLKSGNSATRTHLAPPILLANLRPDRVARSWRTKFEVGAHRYCVAELCRSWIKAAPAAPLARRQRRAQPWGGPPGARRAPPTKTPQISHGRSARSISSARLPSSPPQLSSLRLPRQGRPCGPVACSRQADPGP